MLDMTARGECVLIWGVGFILSGKGVHRGVDGWVHTFGKRGSHGVHENDGSQGFTKIKGGGFIGGSQKGVHVNPAIPLAAA